MSLATQTTWERETVKPPTFDNTRPGVVILVVFKGASGRMLASIPAGAPRLLSLLFGSQAALSRFGSVAATGHTRPSSVGVLGRFVTPKRRRGDKDLSGSMNHAHNIRTPVCANIPHNIYRLIQQKSWNENLFNSPSRTCLSGSPSAIFVAAPIACRSLFVFSGSLPIKMLLTLTSTRDPTK